MDCVVIKLLLDMTSFASMTGSATDLILKFQARKERDNSITLSEKSFVLIDAAATSLQLSLTDVTELKAPITWDDQHTTFCSFKLALSHTL